MAKTKPFDEHVKEYEQWFNDNYYVFKSELEAVREVLPAGVKGLEIGIGGGIFAEPLGIKEGVEPSLPMREKANERGIYPVDGVAEELPFADESYDYALMVTTICFVDDIKKAFKEAHRVLKENGNLILGFVDKNSPVGKSYLKNKDKSLFYKDAVFYSTKDITEMLKTNGFSIISTSQTIFNPLDEVKTIQPPAKGSDKGSFVVIKAKKDG